MLSIWVNAISGTKAQSKKMENMMNIRRKTKDTIIKKKKLFSSHKARQISADVYAQEASFNLSGYETETTHTTKVHIPNY